MFEVHSFVDEIQHKYPPPSNNKIHFDINDIHAFENAFGEEFPSDFYDFLQPYGHGSFGEYFYIWNPFIDDGVQYFIKANKQAKEDYAYLERRLSSTGIDCKFSNGELIVINGDKKYAEFLRVEKIDKYTRSKIIALGDHYPYDFFPEKEGLIYFGRTDDADFFLRVHGKKTSIVMYDDGCYYEFEMGITEFIYRYLTKTIKLPMMDDDADWTFIAYD